MRPLSFIPFLWLQYLGQPLHQIGSFQNRSQQHQAAPRIFMLGHLQQSVGNLGISPEALCSTDQPEILSVIESCRRLHIPVRDYLAAD